MPSDERNEAHNKAIPITAVMKKRGARLCVLSVLAIFCLGIQVLTPRTFSVSLYVSCGCAYVYAQEIGATKIGILYEGWHAYASNAMRYRLFMILYL